MSSEQGDSFNATGPTVVAFETLNPNNQTFGVSVTGTQIGVYAQSSRNPLTTRPTDTSTGTGIGVQAVGDYAGVIGGGGYSGVQGIHFGGTRGTAIEGTSKSGGWAIRGISGSVLVGDFSDIDGGVEGLCDIPNGVGVRGAGAIGVKGYGVDLVNVDGKDAIGVIGESGVGTGVRGESRMAVGVLGHSDHGTGVVGTSNVSVDEMLVLHRPADGVLGKSDNGNGVHGESKIAVGVLGHSENGSGVQGHSDHGTGVVGTSNVSVDEILDHKPADGVLGKSDNGNGVHGESKIAVGVLGHSESGSGVIGQSESGCGGTFQSSHAQLRLIPNPQTGAPVTGLHSIGEIFVDAHGYLFICVGDGYPGTWKRLQFAPN